MQREWRDLGSCLVDAGRRQQHSQVPLASWSQRPHRRRPWSCRHDDDAVALTTVTRRAGYGHLRLARPDIVDSSSSPPTLLHATPD